MKLVDILKIPAVGVSHNPNLTKQVLIPKGEIPGLTGFSRTTFKPGQSADTHVHKTMYEVFYTESGKGVITVEDKEVVMEEGYCLTIEPGERHSQANPFDKDVTWLYFGIATDKL